MVYDSIFKFFSLAKAIKDALNTENPCPCSSTFSSQRNLEKSSDFSDTEESEEIVISESDENNDNDENRESMDDEFDQ